VSALSTPLTLRVTLDLPDWLDAEIDRSRVYEGDDAKVDLAIRLALRNVEHGTGGPFGALVFDGESRIVSAGVNRVVPQSCSVAHAEMMAFMSGQARLGRARFNGDGSGAQHDGQRFTLATSAQPCCMCYGASFWAGLDTMLIGARAEDVTELSTFDEGPLPADWIGELRARHIAVRRDLSRDAARDVFHRYAARNGAAY
jgi:tRNA(Arg) A34 adenosine deaminase TadA